MYGVVETIVDPVREVVVLLIVQGNRTVELEERERRSRYEEDRKHADVNILSYIIQVQTLYIRGERDKREKGRKEGEGGRRKKEEEREREREREKHTLKRGTAWRGCSVRETRSTPTPVSMILSRVIMVRSLSTCTHKHTRVT